MEYNSGSPIYLQVINELKKKMVKGELKPGEKMPSNRELAVLYKVNQNTAARICLLYTSPSPRDGPLSRMPSSA